MVSRHNLPRPVVAMQKLSPTNNRDPLTQDSLESLFRAATSKNAQRFAVNATLIVAGCVPLLFMAVASTALFYHNYLPDQVVKTPVYLQYGSGPNPFGTSPMADLNLKTQQPYDITVSMSMPLSPANTERGNFMVALYFLDSPAAAPADDSEPHLPPEAHSHFHGRNVLFASRRPALVPYRNPVVSMACRLIFLLYHLLVPDSEVLTLDIPMAERVKLASQQSGMPASAYLEIVAGQTLETYDASIIMTAQLSGLRWLMHHYRISTFFAATLVFWSAEVLFMVTAWLAWVGRSGGGHALPPGGDVDTALPKPKDAVKQEDEDISDSPRPFSSYGHQSPLKPDPEDEEGPSHQAASEPLPPGAEADDEADDDGEPDWGEDSGIGTSYSEAGARSLRRRPSHRRMA